MFFLSNLGFDIPIWVAFYTRIISFRELALFNAFYMGLVLVMELPTGALADLIGRKTTMILGYLLKAIGFISVAFAFNFNTILISYVLRGVGEACTSGADTALFYDTLKELGRVEETAKISSRYGFVIRLALGLGTLCGGYLFILWAGLPYFILGIAFLMTAFIALSMIEPRIDSEKFTLKNYFLQTKYGINQLMQNMHTKKLTIYYVLVGGITWACLTYFNQPFAKDAGLSEVEMSWAFATIYVIVAALLLYITHRKNLLTRSTVIIGLPIMMIAGLLPGIVAPKWLAILMLLLVTLTGSSRFTFLNKFTNDEFESKYRATAISTLNMLVSLCALILIGASGVVQEIFSTRVIFSLLGVLTLLVVVPSSISLMREHRKMSTV